MLAVSCPAAGDAPNSFGLLMEPHAMATTACDLLLCCGGRASGIACFLLSSGIALFRLALALAARLPVALLPRTHRHLTPSRRPMVVVETEVSSRRWCELWLEAACKTPALLFCSISPSRPPLSLSHRFLHLAHRTVSAADKQRALRESRRKRQHGHTPHYRCLMGAKARSRQGAAIRARTPGRRPGPRTLRDSGTVRE